MRKRYFKMLSDYSISHDGEGGLSLSISKDEDGDFMRICNNDDGETEIRIYDTMVNNIVVFNKSIVRGLLNSNSHDSKNHICGFRNGGAIIDIPLIREDYLFNPDIMIRGIMEWIDLYKMR